jgi:hypothetical protein
MAGRSILQRVGQLRQSHQMLLPRTYCSFSAHSGLCSQNHPHRRSALRAEPDSVPRAELDSASTQSRSDCTKRSNPSVEGARTQGWSDNESLSCIDAIAVVGQSCLRLIPSADSSLSAQLYTVVVGVLPPWSPGILASVLRDASAAAQRPIAVPRPEKMQLRHVSPIHDR